jgi:hypothetical protein
MRFFENLLPHRDLSTKVQAARFASCEPATLERSKQLTRVAACFFVTVRQYLCVAKSKPPMDTARTGSVHRQHVATGRDLSRDARV